MSDQIHQDTSAQVASAREGRADAAAPGGSGPRGARPAHRPIPPKLYRIGEVVEYSGMSRQTIHNYTTMGLLRESRWTNGGHRLYDESVFGRLDQIAQLKAARKSIEDIRDYFERQNQAPPASK